MNIQHSSRNDNWLTPMPIIKKVWSVLQTVELDPCSSEEANTRVVKAHTYYTKQQDGLKQTWKGTIYCNPPGGKYEGKSLTTLFWKKLMVTKYSGQLAHAIFMAFSVEQLQTSQDKGMPSMGEFVLCIPKKRISFLLEDGSLPGAPSHSNAIIYVPGTIDRSYLFAECFSEIGIIMRRY